MLSSRMGHGLPAEWPGLHVVALGEPTSLLVHAAERCFWSLRSPMLKKLLMHDERTTPDDGATEADILLQAASGVRGEGGSATRRLLSELSVAYSELNRASVQQWFWDQTPHRPAWTRGSQNHQRLHQFLQ